MYILLRQPRVRLHAVKGTEVELKKEECRSYGYNRFNPKIGEIGTNRLQNCVDQEPRPFSCWYHL